MRLTTDALIIRENNNIGEADRFVTALTRELGIVRASAKGARSIKSRNASATQLLSYSRLTLYKGREKYIIDDAEPVRVFFELRSDIEKLSLAQYFCELAAVLAPREEPAEDCLRLFLNALHFLGADERHPDQIKAVVELRLLAHAGFMPDLTACSACGCYESEDMWLLPSAGTLCCGECMLRDLPGSARELHGSRTAGAIRLSTSVLAAMRHILYSEFSKCFSFALPEEGFASLAAACETFLLAQVQRSFNTLTFYHSLRPLRPAT